MATTHTIFNIPNLNGSSTFQKDNSNICSLYHNGFITESSPGMSMDILRISPNVSVGNITACYLFENSLMTN